MFEIGEVYWFKIKGSGERKEVNLKGKVLEENSFMIKIIQDSGKESIIMFNQIIQINKTRDFYEEDEED